MAIFYADENVSLALNDALRTYGHEAFTTRDERRLGAANSGQLLYAAERGWIVLTHNRAHFVLLHDAWHLWARAWHVEPEHAGIIVLAPLRPPRHMEHATLVNNLCNH